LSEALVTATVSADSLNARIEFLTRLLHYLATRPTLSAPPAVIAGPKECSRSIDNLVRNTRLRHPLQRIDGENELAGDLP
jgi:hypothetical protein